MTKRIFSLLLILLFLPIFSVSADTMFFEAYTDGWNSYGAGRYGQGKVLRMQIERPWEYIGQRVTPTQSGGDGVLPQNWEEYKNKGNTVYWIQSAIFPDGDLYVSSADSSLDDPYILPKGTTSTGITTANSAPTTFEGTVKYETKVRFDDFNAHRYIFSPYNKTDKKYNDFLWFDTNGKVYAMCLIDGVATAKEICDWSIGEWYKIEFVLNFDYESISVSVNGGNQLQNAQAQDMRNWTYLMLLNLKHENHAVTEREFSNSYVSGARGYYISENTPEPEESGYYYTIDFTWNTGGVSRIGQANSLQLNPRQPWLYSGASTGTNIGNEGMLPFENEYRGVKKVYLFRTAVWPSGDTEGVIRGDNSIGVPKACTIYNLTDTTGTFIENAENRESDTVSWEMKVRFDDTNSTRKLFSIGNQSGNSYTYTDFVTINRDGTVTVNFKNGETSASVTGGEWTVGKWHSVKLVADLRVNVFSLYFDNEPIVTNVLSLCNIAESKKIKLMQQIHSTPAAQIEEREFSNSYIDFVKAKYIDNNSLLWAEQSDVVYSGGKYTADLSITNTEPDKNLNVKCFMALYKNDLLVGIKSTNVNLSGVKTKTASLSMNGDAHTEVRTFVLRTDTLWKVPVGDGVSTYVPTYYYVCDFTDNNSGYSRASYTKALHCGARQPWTYTGNSTASFIGTEGMLPFSNEYTMGSSKVYWIKTGIWPEGDTEAVFGASNTPIVPGASATYIYSATASFLQDSRPSERVIWEMRLRGDDYNSERNVFSMGYGSSYAYTNFITFATDGTVKILYLNDEGARVTNSETLWSIGQWYDVKLELNFTENTFSVYINGNEILKNVTAPCDLDGWARIKLLEQSHRTSSADLTEREFSNTYVDYVRAQYVE